MSQSEENVLSSEDTLAGNHRYVAKQRAYVAMATYDTKSRTNEKISLSLVHMSRKSQTVWDFVVSRLSQLLPTK